MSNEKQSPDWISLSTIGSVSGLSAGIWLVTNYSYGLVNYFYNFIYNRIEPGSYAIDRTFYCVVIPLLLAIILTPRIISRFFPPIEDKMIRKFIMVLNIILVLSSSHGLQSGYSSMNVDESGYVQDAAFLGLDPNPWLRPKVMRNTISTLVREKKMLEDSIVKANSVIDSLSMDFGVETDLSVIEDVSDQNATIEQYVKALKEVKVYYKALLEEKSDSIDLVSQHYFKIRDAFAKQYAYNIRYDSLLKVLDTEIRRERLRNKKVQDARRKIDSLDRENEH
ncbi:MAG: hypothetical protein ABJG47_07350 [Ekhidna sp.]